MRGHVQPELLLVQLSLPLLWIQWSGMRSQSEMVQQRRSESGQRTGPAQRMPQSGQGTVTTLTSRQMGDQKELNHLQTKRSERTVWREVPLSWTEWEQRPAE